MKPALMLLDGEPGSGKTVLAPTRADTCTADGDVSMGTLRRQKEGATGAATMLKRVSLNAEETELEGQLKSVQPALSAKQAEKDSLVHSAETDGDELLGESRLDIEIACPPHGEMRPEMTAAASGPDMFKFRLYVAGDTPNSLLAIANLTALCQTHLPDRYGIEVVDIFREPKRAMDDGILMTPTLYKLEPLPTRIVVGNLSQTQPVLLTLGLRALP